LKDLPPLLHQKDYGNVNFWLEKAYEEYLKRDDGDVDGRVTKQPRRDRPSNNLEDDEKKHLSRTRTVYSSIDTG
jgi:hypothetical protein